MRWFFATHMKESWPVGVLDTQTTELVQNGVYRYARNPYLLSYIIMFFGLFLIQPSMLMIVLIIVNIVFCHHMILKEKTYLLRIHVT
ncbi:MAG: hypothetical protein JW932_00010 [Deltaproteobacteria bacterium]|nr:hypothetical protein [Deltaproteobacteria bacterium]